MSTTKIKKPKNTSLAKLLEEANPLPLSLGRNKASVFDADGGIALETEYGAGNLGANTPRNQSAAMAALAVHCVNTYEEVVAALERLLKMTTGVLTEDQLDFNHGTKQKPDTLRCRLEPVRDALEKAQNVGVEECPISTHSRPRSPR